MPKQKRPSARSRRAEILSTLRGPVVLRLASGTDAPAFRRLRLEALKDRPDAYAAAFEAEAAEPEGFWINRLARADGEIAGAIYFAESTEGLIGMAGIWRLEGRKVRHSGTIWGVYVRPRWRGQRIGDALVRACVEWARRHRMRIVRLATAAGNEAAVRCYERCGFTPYGLEPEALFVGGRAVDDLLMALPITVAPSPRASLKPAGN
jgi:RimJ/RimL family protein N-acetyltransferase